MLRLPAATIFIIALSAIVTSARAQPVGLTSDTLRKVVDLGMQTVVIARNQDGGATIPPEFARTSRACPPFCITPLIAAKGVETVAELELVDFLDRSVARSQGLLIDTRLPEWFQKSALPGAINMPFTALDPENPYRGAILEALGAAPAEDGWDFTLAQDLLIYSNGPWCDQASRAVEGLLSSGYPAAKIRYYRGGMQDWVMLGLTTIAPPATN